ncbi:hypothetical protein JTB14_035987 [Gonioctena quinquepunctata]|nr:hypothetical protein JTB14_035987 [Gonioctena quinquepunctata]
MKRAIHSNNLMLFNVEESKSESLEAKIADDKKIAIQVLESIGVESNDLTKVIRIGRQGNKPRPIKMILSNSNAVGYALRLKNRLLNTKFRIASELQQEQMKKVQDELKQRRDRVTETWLTSSYYDAEFGLINYNIFRTDRNVNTSNKSRGGGVMMCFKKELNVKILDGISPNVEHLFILLKITSANVFWV